jgi:UDP-N-acetylglucosamine--N-acetylmuramyl-(pentapeptide) pyrophosphoryl-undecaprenol N-acetylglucosamine transferase
MQKIKRLVLTGGGTAGHVMPHLAMLDLYRAQRIQVDYIGSTGVEKSLIEAADIPFHVIRTGKLRRYFSFKNLFDVFNIVIGTLQSFLILVRIRPEIIFSKGGFVSVPVCVAGWMLRIPVVSHESDYTPGLATRIIARFASMILITFEDTRKFLGRQVPCESVGTPIRAQLRTGNRDRGLRFCGLDPFDSSRKVLLVIGGTQGAQRINDAVVESIDELLKRFQIIHICGKSKLTGIVKQGYFTCEFAGSELADMLASADVVISRAGANTIFELLSLKKPMLLIPLEIGSRGDQVHNANYFKTKGWAAVLSETKLNGSTLLKGLTDVEVDSSLIVNNQTTYAVTSPEEKILSILYSLV